MTERWRKKLGDLDKQGPNDDVFERAKDGPMHLDESLPGMKTSTRIATAVAAFAVFTLAISVFAIPALRMRGTEAGSATSGLFPLWPSQTPDQLKQLQADAAVGNAAWALDPKLVAERFAHDVMGWSDASVGQELSSSCAVAYGGYYPGQSSSPGYGPGDLPTSGPVACVPSQADAQRCEQIFGDAPSAIPCTDSSFPPAAPAVSLPGYDTPSGLDTGSAAPSAGSSGGGGAFLTFLALPCGGGLNQCIEFGAEHIILFQPLQQGDGQIWAVMEARSDSITLSTAATQNVRSGASIGATSQYQRGITTLGYASCGATGGSSDGKNMVAGFSIMLDTSLPASASCSGQQPGYAWGAQATTSLADGNGGVSTDPLEGASGVPLMGLTAVPVVMTFPDLAQGADETATSPVETPLSGPSPTAAPTRWTTYTDPYGWTIDVPSDWRTDVIKVAGAGTQGARFIGDNLSIQISTQTAKPGAPPPGLKIPGTDDSRFPLNSSDLLYQVEGGLGGHLQGDGLTFDVLVLSPSLSSALAADQDILDHMISSISFQPWSAGDVRHDWAAIPTSTDDVSWITARGGLYILFRTPDGYKLYGSISCAGADPRKTSSTPDGYAVLDCPDGSTWQMNAAGASGGGGDAATNDPPPEWPVVTAHDGTLIAWVLPGVFSEGTGGSPSP